MSDNRRIQSECKACRTKIIYLLTEKNKLMPVDADTVDKDDQHFNYKKHKSHFVTCTRPEVFRKPRIIDPKEKERIDEENFRRDLKIFKEKLSKDTRPFIKFNKIEVTMPRFNLLERCAKLNMPFDDLISKDNGELREWLSMHEAVESEQLSLL